MKALLTRYGVIIENNKLPKEFVDNEIKKNLRFEVTIKVGKEDKKMFYEEFYEMQNGNLILPRFAGLNLVKSGKIPYENLLPKGIDVAKDNFSESKFALNESQTKLAEHLLKDFFHNDRGCVLVKDPGTGKTYIAMHLMKTFGKKTLFVVPDKNLAKSVGDAFQKEFPKLRIGKYHMRNFDVTASDLVIITIQALTKRIESINEIGEMKVKPGQTESATRWIGRFGFSIYDEVDNYVGRKFKQAFNVFQTQYIMGMTGTPHNSCNPSFNILRKVYEYRIGKIFRDPYSGNSYEKFDITVIPIKYNNPPTVKTTNVSTLIGELTKDSDRNKIITDAIKKFDNRNILVLADRRSYLEDIKKDLGEMKDLSLVYSGSSKKTVDEAFTKSRIILSTYKFLGTGTSIPRLDTLIFATPRKFKGEQFNARILRAGTESKKKIIVDIIDNGTFLRKQYEYRKKIYENIGAKFSETI